MIQKKGGDAVNDRRSASMELSSSRPILSESTFRLTVCSVQTESITVIVIGQRWQFGWDSFIFITWIGYGVFSRGWPKLTLRDNINQWCKLLWREKEKDQQVSNKITVL